jgi:hypothetical protein
MRHGLSLLLAILLFASPARAAKALFDNSHAETAGNADWVIDNDQPTPSPAQSGIGPNTPGTYWTGALSSWGVDLVKRGYTVETNTSALTYGSSSNPQDLSHYDVLVIDEPNTLFTSAEASAILSFVSSGGGLVAISDHSGSDRNNDGYDSPMIWNAMDPSHLLGVHFAVAGESNNNITQTSTNVNGSSSDSVTHGSIGVVGGLAFHNGSTMTLFPGVNPSVRGEVWMNGLSQTSTTGLMCASAVYGNGRVVWTSDSSPADDGNGQSGNSLYNGWGEAGANDSTLFLNATLWATRRSSGGGGGDTTPPTASVTSPEGGETWKAGSSHTITWSASDNVGVSTIDLAYSTDGGATYPGTIATGLSNSGSYTWSVPNAPSTTARVRVTAHDAAGNTGSGASTGNFTIDRWTLTASAGTGGTISPSGAVAVVQGGNQSFAIAASGGYSIADVTVDGGSVGAVTGYTFTNVAASHTIAASFSSSGGSFTITASAGSGGSISPSGADVVASGATPTFTITPNSGYHVAGVTVDGTGVGALTSYTFNPVGANHTIAATFSNATLVPWPMATGNYAESFGDIANWTNNFASGIGANRFASVPVEGSGTIPDGFHTTASTATFVSGTSGGVQKGSGSIELLSTGTTDNTSADAIDLFIDFTAVNAGTLGFSWATVFNSTGDRKGSLHVYTSTDGSTFTELTGADVLNFQNNVTASGTISNVALPAAFTGNASARIRFYYHNGTGGTTGSRPKISIDDLTVTGTGQPHPARAIPVGPEGPRTLALELARPRPNPATGSMELSFTLPRAGAARIEVLDLAGRRVWSAAGSFAAGEHSLRWEGREADGSPGRAGVYFVRLVSDSGVRTARIVRL